MKEVSMLCKATTPDPVLGTFGGIYPDDADLRWVQVIKGNKGDLIGLLVEPGEERGKVVLIDDLPGVARPSDFAVVSVTPTRSGRAYHGRVALALASRTAYKTAYGCDGKPCFFNAASLEAAEAALARLLADRASQAEQDARRYNAAEAERQAAKAAFEADLAAMSPAEAELVRLMKSHDWWYDYSDDGNVWRAGRDRWDKIRAAFLSLPQGIASELWVKFAPGQFREALPA
jgi:hypothetical protein